MHLVKLLQPIAGQKGFTLIELLVVMAIGAMLVGLAPPAFDRLRSASEYRDTVRGLVTGLRQTRQNAISQGLPSSFMIDTTKRQYGAEGRPMTSIPDSVQIKTTVGSRQGEAEQQTLAPRITFMPDGGSTGGILDVVRTSGQGTLIRVDWLLGQISQEPRTP